MKTINTADATGAALDWLVAKCEGHSLPPFPGRSGIKECWINVSPSGHDKFAPSTDWSQGGPIIDRELIAVSPYGYMDEAWRATTLKPEKHFTAYGDTALIAAMRCFVASKLGDTVEVPEELIS